MITVLTSETLTVSSEAIGLTLAFLSKEVTCVKVYCEGAIRFWTSGKVPNSTDGVPMYEGTEREFSAAEAKKFRAVRKGDNDATIHVQYYRVY